MLLDKVMQFHDAWSPFAVGILAATFVTALCDQECRDDVLARQSELEVWMEQAKADFEEAPELTIFPARQMTVLIHAMARNEEWVWTFMKRAQSTSFGRSCAWCCKRLREHAVTCKECHLVMYCDLQCMHNDLDQNHQSWCNVRYSV